MSAQEMNDYFDLLIDKVGTAYFIDSEIDSFLNNAQIEYIKSLLPSNEGGVVNIEADQIVSNNLFTLFYETAGLTPNGSGEITKANINAALNTASGDSEPFLYVLNINWTKSGQTYPVKFTRHNDWYAMERNSFKQGVAARPRYKALATKFIFSPIDTGASVKFTLLKHPVDITTPGTDCELPEHTHKKIVEIAVDIATAALRDAELKQLNGNG